MCCSKNGILPDSIAWSKAEIAGPMMQQHSSAQPRPLPAWKSIFTAAATCDPVAHCLQFMHRRTQSAGPLQVLLSQGRTTSRMRCAQPLKLSLQSPGSKLLADLAQQPVHVFRINQASSNTQHQLTPTLRVPPTPKRHLQLRRPSLSKATTM